MRVISPRRYSYIVGTLLLFCQLSWFTVSQSYSTAKNVARNHGNRQTINKKREWTVIIESAVGNNDATRAIEDSSGFDDSASEPTNGATSSDAEVNPINETIPTNEIDVIIPDDYNIINNNITNNNTFPTTTGSKPAALPVSGSQPVIIDVTSIINLELLDTPSLMSREQQSKFLEITVGLLSFYIFRDKPMPLLVESEGVKIELTRQSRAPFRRTLQQQGGNIGGPLFLGIHVTGRVIKEVPNALNYTTESEQENLDFDEEVKKIFIEREAEYLESLKFVDGDFFSLLENANIILENETNIDENSGGNTDEGEGLGNLPFKDVFDEPLENGYSSGDSIQQSNSGDLSLGVTIGVAIGAVFLLIIIAVLTYYICVKKSGVEKSADNRKYPSPQKTKWTRFGGTDDPLDSVAEQNLLRSQQPSNDKNRSQAESTSDVASSTDDVESQGIYSYNQSHASSGSVYTNGGNPKLHLGNDSMSYAYSLEPGIEPSVVGSVNTNDRSSLSNQDNVSGIPIFEIPQVNLASGKNTGNETAAHNKEDIDFDRFGNTQIETVPSELKLTKSELEMLPSNLRSSDDEDDRDENNNIAFLGGRSIDEMIIEKVLAPAGKLGLVIDTTIEGPVVHSVKQGSDLSGKMFPGDIIIAIDKMDTRAMSASAITAVMVKTANQTRILTVRRGR